MTADVYSVPPHTGRGGWSWYTGSAGWMYRLILESILGLRREVVDGQPTLLVAPSMPPHWNGFEVDYRFAGTSYRLQFSRSGDRATTQLFLDGQPLAGNRLPLRDDGQVHEVQVALASPTAVPAGTTSHEAV
jgi:cellobiose phosphorylase